MSIFHVLLLVFVLVPLVEIYLLIKVGSVLGALPTVLLVVATAVIGVALLRYQGLYTLARVNDAMNRGELPAQPMMEGAVLLVCGALLLTPGLLTDVLGFLGLVPGVRRWLVSNFLKQALVPSPRGGGQERRGPTIIDGEYRREEKDED